MMNKGMIRVLLAALFFIALANPTSAAPPSNTLTQHTVAQLIESETVGIGEDEIHNIKNAAVLPKTTRGFSAHEVNNGENN